MLDKNQGDDKAMNTIRAGRYDLNRLLDALDARNAKHTVDREYVRWGYRQQSVTLELHHPGGTVVRLPVATRNLSNSGIAVLHSAFVHPGSACVVVLEHMTMGPVDVPGAVTRCEHIGGTVHEVGIKFTQPIDTREFMRLDLLSEAFCLERVAPDKLQGTLVYIDDCELDLKLVEKLLEPTFMSVRSFTDPEEGLDAAKRGCDLVLLDLHLGETSGASLIKRLRDDGVRAPILIVTGDTSQHAKDALRSEGADAMVSKPLTSEKLLRAIAEFMIGGADAGPLISTLSPDSTSRALVAGFVENLGPQIQEIEKSIREDNTEACRRICMKLASSAPPLGFDPIGEIATRVMEQLGTGVGISYVLKDLQTLVKTCRRARAVAPTGEKPDASPDDAPEAEAA
ncbi:MAG: response regulator [Phycisphaerales bacterium JB059]